MKAWELLSDRAKWTTGTGARRVDASPTHGSDPLAVSWCAIGAISACYSDGDERQRAYDKALDIALSKGGKMLGEINDALGYDAVLAVLKEADV